MKYKLRQRSLLALNNLEQLNYNNIFFKEIYLLKNIIKNIYRKLEIFTIFNYIDISKNRISLELYLFISSKKIILYKKNKNFIQRKKSYKKINQFLLSKLKNLNLNLFFIKINILNKEVNKKGLQFLYKILKKYYINLFEKRFNLFIDFLKFCILFNSLKINTKNFLQILSHIFKNLHKRKHSKFLMLLKTLVNFFLSNHFENKILGIKIIIKGKLKGKTMASNAKFLKGDISNSFNKNLDYSKVDIFTKYGVFGMKCWITKN